MTVMNTRRTQRCWNEPGVFAGGCSPASSCKNFTLKRQKSVSSQQLSISACWTVFPVPNIVIALISYRYRVERSSAAVKNIEALLSNEIPSHSARVASAHSMALFTNSSSATWYRHTGFAWLDGFFCVIILPVVYAFPPIMTGSSGHSEATLSRAAFIAFRSGEFGAYERIGSLVIEGIETRPQTRNCRAMRNMKSLSQMVRADAMLETVVSSAD